MDRADVTRLLKYLETHLTPALEPYLFEQHTAPALPAFLTLDVAGFPMILWSVGDGEYETMIPLTPP